MVSDRCPKLCKWFSNSCMQPFRLLDTKGQQIVVSFNKSDKFMMLKFGSITRYNQRKIIINYKNY